MPDHQIRPPVTYDWNASVEHKDSGSSPNHNPSSLNPILLFPVSSHNECHVPDLHCDHLEFKLSIHLRQRSGSLQEEDKERSPFPPITSKTPNLQVSRCRPCGPT